MAKAVSNEFSPTYFSCGKHDLPKVCASTFASQRERGERGENASYKPFKRNLGGLGIGKKEQVNFELPPELCKNV